MSAALSVHVVSLPAPAKLSPLLLLNITLATVWHSTCNCTYIYYRLSARRGLTVTKKKRCTGSTIFSVYIVIVTVI